VCILACRNANEHCVLVWTVLIRNWLLLKVIQYNCRHWYYLLFFTLFISGCAVVYNMLGQLVD